MTIPDYQSTMLPLLQLAGDGRDHTLREAEEFLAAAFTLTPAQRNELLPSGRQKRFLNRVGWAKTYLQKAGLLEPNGRGRFRITPRGMRTLESPPERIDNAYLKQFPEHLEFMSLRNRPNEATESSTDLKPPGETSTPEETLEQTYDELRKELGEDLLERIKTCDPKFFEELVVDLLVSMGYGGSRKDAGQAIGQSGDEGIDGIIKEDRLGLDVVYLQAKRWNSTVGRPVVQAFAGSLEGQRARKGVLITTSNFSSDAREYVRRIEKKIVLIDGTELASLMIDHGVGVAHVATYVVKKIDDAYFGEE